MALRVPTADSFGTQLRGLPDVRQRSDRPAASFLNPGETLALESASQAATALNNAAIQLAKQEREKNIALQAKAGANDLDVFDQDQAFGNREAGLSGWLDLTGAAALKQADGRLLSDVVMEKRQQKIEAIRKEFGTDEARQLFDEYATRSGTKVQGLLRRHENEQNKNFNIGTLSNRIDVTKRNLALYNNDEETLATGIDTIMQNAMELGKLQHGSEELGMVEGRKQISDALQQAMLSALQHNDYGAAMRIQDRFGDHLDPTDRINTQDKIAEHWAANKLQTQPQEVVDLLSADTLKSAIRQQESNGRDFNDNGEPLVSSDGKSMFAMQVTHDTAANPGFGITPARDRSAEEYNRVGSELVDKLRERYQNDPAKVAAAYNAGAGAVDKAIAEGGENWIDHIPEPTRQNYVPNVLRSLRTGTPADYMNSMDRRKWLNAAQAQIQHGRNVYATELKRAIDDQYSQATNTGQPGALVSPENFQRAFGDKWEANYQEYRDNMDFAAAYFSIKTMPTAQALQLLEASRPKPGAADFEREQKQYDALSKAISTAEKTRNADPIEWAAQNGYTVKPIDWKNRRDTQGELAQRGNIARQLGEQYGTSPNLLTNNEASELTRVLNDGSEDEQLSALKTLADGINDPRDYATTLQKIRPDSPATIIAGSLIGMDRIQKTSGIFRDSINAVRGIDVARTILKGEAILNPSKAEREQNGKSTGVTLPAGLNQAIYSELGDALAGDLQTEQGVVSAIRAFYAAKMDKAKAEGNGVQDTLLSEAVQSITGGITEHAGKKVVMPFGMNETDFLDQAEAKLKEALGSKAAFVAFGKMPLIPVGANRYALQNGTNMLSINGSPVILEFDR